MSGPRIVVVGTSGAGKTTLARRLAERHGVPHVEMDALRWGPDWTMTRDEDMRAGVAAVAAGPAWVVDGNYAVVRPLLFARATQVVWLDLPLALVVTRIVLRTLRRVVTREVLWNGNRERFWTSFVARDSVIRWAIRTFPERRALYARLAADPTSPPFVRLRTPREVARWLERDGGRAE